MKERTHQELPGSVLTADPPGSADEIDLDRIVWDPEYRRAVKPLLGPEGAVERPGRKAGARRRRRRD